MSKPTRKPVAKVNHLTTALMIKKLMKDPCTIQDLADEVGHSYDTTRMFLSTLHAHGLVYIYEWRNNSYNRPTVLVYHWGNEYDARKPIKPRAQVQKEYKARRKAREHAASSSLGMFAQLVKPTQESKK